MAMAHLISSPNVFSLKTGPNRRGTKLSFNSIYCESSGGSKTHKIKTQIQYDPLRFQLSAFHHHYKSIQNYAVKAVTSESESEASNSNNIVDFVKNLMAVLYQFLYPYALFGHASVAMSASLVAVEKLSDISPLFFIGLLQAVLPHFLVILYVNGVNQLFDFEIDKINKPYLPLASGKISFRNCVIIAASSAILGLGVHLMIGSTAMIWNFVLSTTLWTCYSANVPFLRWKKNPVLASLVMIACSTLINPITYFLHMQVFWICVSLFEMAFGVAFLAGASSSSPFWIKFVTCLGNAVLGSILWYQTKYVDMRNPASTRSFYSFTWKLMMGSNVFLPLIR